MIEKRLLTFIKKSAYSAIFFFSTLIILSVWYAAWTTINPTDYASHATLTSTLMSNIIGNIDDLNTRLTALSTPRGILQYVQNNYTSAITYAGSATRPGSEISALATTITTTTANSQIIYNAVINCEIYQNSAFILQRDIGGVITELWAPSAAGSRLYGIAPVPFDNENLSTMSQINIQFIDTPNVPSGTVITYRLRFYSDSVLTLSLNRTLSDADTTTYERTSSNVRLQEFKQ